MLGSFGESRLSEGPNYYKSKILNEKPMLSFEFKYRSKSEQQHPLSVLRRHQY